MALLRYCFPGPPPMPQWFIDEAFKERYSVHCASDLSKAADVLKRDRSNVEYEDDEDRGKVPGLAVCVRNMYPKSHICGEFMASAFPSVQNKLIRLDVP